jgi:type I restriction enzyme, S subunit
MTAQKNVGWVRPEAVTHQDQKADDAVVVRGADWPTARVGDICNAVNGRAFKPTEWTDKGVPIIRIQNLKKPDALFNYFAGKLEDKFKVTAGDLLFAWSGTPGTSFGAHIWRGPDAALNQHIFNLHYDRSRVDAKYFCYALNRNVADYVTKAQGGVGLAHITKGKFENSEIPLPPLNQQKQIVAEIEKQFSRLDEAVANLKRVKANLKRYKAAVLKAAVEGRLVEIEAEIARREGRSYETGEQLLQRILETRRRQWKGKGKYKEPAAPDTTDLPELPEGWVWASVEELGDVGTGATPLRSRHDYYEGGKIPWVTSGALNEEFVSAADEYITDLAVEETNAKVFPAHTLLVAMYGEGKTRGKVSELLIDAATNQACAAIVMQGLSERVRDFMKLFFLKNYEDIRRFSSGGVQPNLNLSHIKATVIPFPSLVEQHRIVSEVDRRLSLVRETGAQVDANLQRAERMRQAILQQAFVGRLSMDIPEKVTVRDKRASA